MSDNVAQINDLGDGRYSITIPQRTYTVRSKTVLVNELNKLRQAGVPVAQELIDQLRNEIRAEF